MLVDWFTVVAQATNFLILVWLLRRYLYRPVLAAIDAREKKIAAELADAAATRTQAQKERDDFRQQSENLARQREKLLRKAADEAGAERKRLVDAARQDAEALRTKMEDAIKNERDQLGREIVTRAQQEVFGLARKTLTDLADTTLEDRMVDVFLRRLRGMQDEQKALFKEAAGATSASAVVRSAFELQPAQRSAIESTLAEHLAAGPKLTFEIFPGLVSGIELRVDGRKLAWSVTDYLGSLAESAAALVGVRIDATSAPATNAHAG